MKPDIVYHPDGSVTYEAPSDNPSNIPSTLVPAPNASPIDLEAEGDNQFAAGVLLSFFNPASRSGDSNVVTSFSIGGPIYRDRNTDQDCMHVTFTLPNGVTGKQPFRPGTLKAEPYNGSSPVPTNRTSPSPVPQPIPTKPDGTADLKPFNPRSPDPVRPRQNAPQQSLQPIKTPQIKPLGKVGTPQQPAPETLPPLAPLFSGLPSPSPLSPLSPFLDPRVPSQGVGEGNPVRSASINAPPSRGQTPEPAPKTAPPLVSVPTTGNPTKTTSDTALKAKEQLQLAPQP